MERFIQGCTRKTMLLAVLISAASSLCFYCMGGLAAPTGPGRSYPYEDIFFPIGMVLGAIAVCVILVLYVIERRKVKGYWSILTDAAIAVAAWFPFLILLGHCHDLVSRLLVLFGL